MCVMRWMEASAAAVVLACNGPSKEPTRTEVAREMDIRIESDIACAACSIQIDTVMTLPNVDAFPSSGTLARDPASGAIYIVDRAGLQVKAYAADGRPLGTIGRRGGGPGEYERIRNVMVGADGAVHILDAALSRHTVFTPDGTLLRHAVSAISPTLMNPAVVRTDGQLVVNSARPGGQFNVEVIDTTGRVARSLDPAPTGVEGKWWLRSRVFWKRPTDELFIARRFAPSIDIYTADFAKNGSITRVADWFAEREPQTEPSDGVYDKPISPTLQGMWEDSQGHLWLQMLVPSPAWVPQRRPARFTVQAYRKLGERPRIQTIVEVVDLERRRVLARSRIDGALGVALGEGFFADYMAENAVGEPELRILQAKFHE